VQITSTEAKNLEENLELPRKRKSREEKSSSSSVNDGVDDLFETPNYPTGIHHSASENNYSNYSGQTKQKITDF
jgi:hypothetical protein